MAGRLSGEDVGRSSAPRRQRGTACKPGPTHNPSHHHHYHHHPGALQTHLANAAGLAEGADGSHVALVPGTELGGVVVGGGIQGDAGMDVSRGLQMVALTGGRRRDTGDRKETQKGRENRENREDNRKEGKEIKGRRQSNADRRTQRHKEIICSYSTVQKAQWI